MVHETPSTVLIVHGTWHQPQHYEPLIDAFKRQGIEAICPRLPSFAAAPSVGLREDVQHIQSVVENLLAGGRDFIVLAHSYGGVVSCEAFGAHYAKRVRVMAGLQGGLCGIVFMSAFLPLPGQSLADALGGTLPPFIPVDAKGMCVMLDPPQAFYHDLPPDQAAHWTSLLAPCPAITQFARTTNVSYLHHPAMYIYAEHDQRLLYPIQQWMVKRAKVLGATFKEKVLQSSHSPFLSMPNEVVNLVKAESIGGFFSVTEDFEQQSTEIRVEFGEMMSRMGPPPDQAA